LNYKVLNKLSRFILSSNKCHEVNASSALSLLLYHTKL
jgi:hypothetical protein